MSINKVKTLYILGAGASFGAYGENKIGEKPTHLPPTDSNFFQISPQIRDRGTGILADEVLRDVYEQYQKTHNISLEAYYRDIETRGEIGTFAKGKHRPKSWTKRQKNLSQLIRRVLIQTTCKLNENGHYVPIPSEILGRILEKLSEKDAIITFNYDTLIEESFPKDKFIWSPKDGYGIRVGGTKKGEWSKYFLKGKEYVKSKVTLLKMHGGLNWIEKPKGQVTLKSRPYVARKNHTENVFLLPPSYHKRIDRNPYKLIWERAKKYLDTVDTLIIIGYSLPQNDFLAQALFAEAFRQRKARRDRSLKKVIIANPDISIRNNFLELLKPAMNSRTQIVTYNDIGEYSRNL